MTENGISPCAVPGQEGSLFIATSYEHDESWATNEDPTIKAQQTQKRFRKKQTFVAQEFVHEDVAYEIINPYAEKFFVTRGINRYNIEMLIKNNSDRGLIVIKVFHPFCNGLVNFFKTHENQIKRLIFVEMNYEWQMERLVRYECGLVGDSWEEKITHFRKYTLYPIFIEELEGLMK
jgi:2-oxoglutarate ferredoxin oxidoreductase subunit alpha